MSKMVEQLDNVWWQTPHLNVKDIGTLEGRSTRSYEVWYRVHGTLIGHIHWAVLWRQYAFYPVPNKPLDKNSLTELAELCIILSSKRKEKYKPRKTKSIVDHERYQRIKAEENERKNLQTVIP